MAVIKVEYYSKGFYRVTLLDINGEYKVIFIDEGYILKANNHPKEKKVSE